MTYFAFNGRLNQELGRGEPGEFVGEIKNPEGGRWIYKNTGLDLKVGDTIYYWVFVQHGRFGYRLDGQNYQIRSEEVLNFVVLLVIGVVLFKISPIPAVVLIRQQS